MIVRLVIVAFLVTILCACEPANDDPGPGGVSVDDARSLDEAAARLDAEAQQGHEE